MSQFKAIRRLFNLGLAVEACLLILLISSGCSSPDKPRINVAQEVLRSYRNEDIPRADGPLTSESAVALAMQHNPDLRVLREELRVAQTLQTGAVQIRDPELRLSYGSASEQQNRHVTMPLTNAPWVTNDFFGVPVTDFPSGRASNERITTEDRRDYQATLRFFPPNPWLMRAQIREADAAVLAAHANVSALEWDVSMAVRETYARAQHLQEDIRLIDRLIALGSNTISLVNQRVGQGTATLLDSITASKNHLALISDRSVAERDYAAALQELATLTGVGAADMSLSDEKNPFPLADPRTADSSFLESIAVRNRVDISARILDLRAAEASLRRAKSESAPWITFIQASVGRSIGKAEVDPYVQWTSDDGVSGAFLSPETQWEEDEGHQWRVDAGITLPLFSWMTNPTAAESAECIRKSNALSAALKRVVADVRDAVRNLQNAADNLSRYRSTSGPDRTMLETILATAEQQGTLRPDDRSKIETALVEVDRTTQKLEYEYRQAYMNLSTKVGRDLSFLWGPNRPASMPPSRNSDDVPSDTAPMVPISETPATPDQQPSGTSGAPAEPTPSADTNVPDEGNDGTSVASEQVDAAVEDPRSSAMTKATDAGETLPDSGTTQAEDLEQAQQESPQPGETEPSGIPPADQATDIPAELSPATDLE
ncbi:MAG: TolC family protein [bacterium]